MKSILVNVCFSHFRLYNSVKIGRKLKNLTFYIWFIIYIHKVFTTFARVWDLSRTKLFCSKFLLLQNDFLLTILWKLPTFDYRNLKSEIIFLAFLYREIFLLFHSFKWVMCKNYFYNMRKPSKLNEVDIECIKNFFSSIRELTSDLKNWYWRSTSYEHLSWNKMVSDFQSSFQWKNWKTHFLIYSTVKSSITVDFC